MATNSISRTRATNLTGLIDIDALVEANTLRQKSKIKTETQNLKIEEYKKEQYGEIQKKAKSFYDKYFDVAKEDSLFRPSSYNTMKATSNDSDSISVTASTTSRAGKYSVTVNEVPKAASESISDSDLKSLAGQTIKINNVEFTLKSGTDITAKEIAEDLNKQLKAKGIKATATYTDLYKYEGQDANGNNIDKYGGMIIKADTAGSDENLLKVTTNDSTSSRVNGFVRGNGQDASVTIKDLSTGVERKYDNASNQIDVDGISFKISENAVKGVPITVTNAADVSDLKKKIVDFVKDYNDLMGTINTKLYEKRDKSYMPLTEEDKEGLTESQIEKLENKAKQGLLRNDNYLTSFADDMKMSVATVMKQSWGGVSAGLSFDKIGIKPKNDYSTQNGLLDLDEEKLGKALEENIDGIQELFIRNQNSDKASEADGIFTKLKRNLEYHVTKADSMLVKRAGSVLAPSETSSEMAKDIKQRKTQIKEMEAALKAKEDSLYTRYSKLESNLSALQSQQSSLASYFTK